jgi:iron complex transport system substrate-binding protein
LYEDKWSLPAGESFMANLFKDANTNYLWSKTKGTGSLVLSLESVIETGKSAELWIGSGIFTNYQTMLESNNHYQTFKAFNKKKIFNFSKRRGEQGGVLFFELAPIQPHIVLKDLVKAAHPDLLPNYNPYFLEPLD